MPGKPRSRKGGYSPQSKKKKKRVVSPVVTAGKTAVAAVDEPVTDLELSAQPESVPAPVVKSVAVANPYIARELRTIVILAAVIVIILIILANVLA